VTDLRYPIGKYEPITATTAEQRRRLIEKIAFVPRQLRGAVEGLTPAQLDTPYRPDGWTARQVAHHVADSHLNGYIRFRWALTEADPLIKVYDEKAWALLPDASAADPEVSLALIEALHARWVIFLRAMTQEQFNLTLRHPEYGPMNMETMLGLYEWHGRHHTAHIISLRKRMRW
jgi:hypothetical protein